MISPFMSVALGYIFFLVVIAALLWLVFESFSFRLKVDGFFYFVLGLVICLVFIRINLWVLLVMFEFMLMPIMVIVISAGGNPARISASAYLVFYTLLFSLPLLVILVNNFYNFTLVTRVGVN